jgi:hypothetical protein
MAMVMVPNCGSFTTNVSGDLSLSCIGEVYPFVVQNHCSRTLASACE